MTSRMASAGDAATDDQLIAAVRRGNDHAFGCSTALQRPDRPVCRLRACATAAAPRTSSRRSSCRPCGACGRPTATITSRPWIFEIAKNAAMDLYRRTSRAEEVSIHADDALRPADQLRLVGVAHSRPENAFLHKERLDQLRVAFAGLSQNHHRVLVLRELRACPTARSRRRWT